MTGVPFAGFLMFALDAAAYAAVTQTLKENGAHETAMGLHKKDSARLRALSIGKNAARLPWKAHNRTAISPVAVGGDRPHQRYCGARHFPRANQIDSWRR